MIAGRARSAKVVRWTRRDYKHHGSANIKFMKDVLGKKQLFDRSRGGISPEDVEASKRRIKRAAIGILVLVLAVLWTIFRSR